MRLMKTRGRRFVGLLTTVMTLAALAIPLVAQPVQANHGSRTLQAGHCSTDPAPPASCQDSNTAVVENEVDTNPAGSTHTMRAVLFNSSGANEAPADQASGPINIDWEIESGPGDISGAGNPAGNTPNSPDLTCTVPEGSASCEVSYTTSSTGTDTIRVWIDHDNNNATADPETYDATEGRLADNDDCGENPDDPLPPDSGDCANVNVPSNEEPGSKPEPDGTDVISKTWAAGGSTILDCNPETATNPSTGTGSGETYTCTATDEFGNPKSRIDVDAENMAGANDPDNAAATPVDYDNATGTEVDFCENPAGNSCSGTVPASDAETGSANICFWLDTNPGDATFNQAGPPEDGGDCDLETQGQDDPDVTDTVTKTWQARSAAGGGVDAEPETDVNDTGADHEITATVYDQFGAAFVSATTVKFEFFQGSPTDNDGNTPDSPDLTCTTNNSSSCSVTYTSNVSGRDRVCVWTNEDPVMTGDNQNGTCDPDGTGSQAPEGLNDPDDAAGTADAPEPVNDDVDVVEKIWGAAGEAARLDCEPETDTNPTGTTHEITCTATDVNGDPVEDAFVDVEFTGANDPDSADSPMTPDAGCQTVGDDPLTPLDDETGTCSFRHGPDAGVGTTDSAGLTTYRAWIDSDNNNGTVEADTSEGRDEGATPGATIEPDNTDVVEKSWVAQPASVTITPQTDTANVGACNPYTITALNSNNQPAQGAIIDVEQIHALAANNTQNDEPTVDFCVPSSGPNPSDVDTTQGDLGPNSASTPKEDPDNPGTAGGETVEATNASGQVTIGIEVAPGNDSDGSGQVDITAWFEASPDDDDPNTPQDTATKLWEQAEGRTINCEPETASRSLGTQHTITCTVRDASGDPVQGESVTFSESGPGSIQGPTTDTSDENGETTVTVTSSEAGQQTVTGTLTDDLQGAEPGEVDECDRAAGDPSGAPAGVCSDDVTVTWQSEAECSDGIDNDGDGEIDFPADDGCDSADDNDESDPQQTCPGFANDPRNQIVGTPGDDSIMGTPGDDIICGLGGNDTITGEGGDDLIFGGEGNDDLRGNDGNDEVRGEGGKDAIRGNDGSDILFGGNQNDVILGNAGSDLLVGSTGQDILRGGKDNDTARGGKNDDTIQGGTGHDELRGGKGRDTLRGGAGDDLIRGGGGDDSLRGGAHDDRLNGGKGTDSCTGGRGNNAIFNCEN